MMDGLVERLHHGAHSLVVGKGEDVRTFDGRGVSDLYRLLREEPSVLTGASVADKVVGKAALALMILGGVKEVFADVVSRQALALCEERGIEVRYGTLVPYIVNRAQTGWCPMEIRCRDCATPEECLKKIEQFIEENRKHTA